MCNFVLEITTTSTDMKTTTLIICLTVAFTASSCSLYNSLFSKETSSGSGTAVKTQTVSTNKGKKDKNKPVLPTPEPQRGNMPTKEQLLGAQWNIVSVGETQTEAEDDTPYIAFDQSGRFYAGDGCNVLNGDYVLRSDGSLVFSQVLSTMKYCPDVTFAAIISEALSDGKKYMVDCKRIGQETYLYLKNEKGKTAVTLRRHNMEFLNGNWRVTAIDGENISDDELTLFIDIPELKVHGNTGCNYFNGDIYIDPARSNAIDFSNMGITTKACRNADRERAMMVALEQAASAIAGGSNDVLILDEAGKQVMKLKRIPFPED